MSSNSYRELLEKYYNGDTSVEEERLLKNNGQLPLAELSSGKPEMDWSFDEFLAAAQPQNSSRKGMLRSIHPVKYAAAIVVIALLAVALNAVKKENLQGTTTAFNPPAVIQKEKISKKDTGKLLKPVPATNTAIATSNPVKKQRHSVPVQQPPAAQKNDDFFVMVDGKRITDENEALAILQQSLQKVSGNVQQTMAGINNSPKLDVKFK